MAQKPKAHAHVNFNNSLHEQVIPVEGSVNNSNVYIPSSNASSTSLDGADPEHNSELSEGRFHYPQDLLGMSWGSYLHSGPPTRVQTSTKAKGAVTTDHDPSSRHTAVTNSPAKIAATHESMEDHLKTPQVPMNDHKTTLLGTKHSTKTVKLVSDHDWDSSEQNASKLYLKLRDLLASLSDCNLELERYGLETISLGTPSSLLSRLENARKPQGDSSKDTVTEYVHLSSKLIQDIIEYLEEMIKRLVKLGRKLNEQALFLQRTGKQLGRNQQSFMEEQALLAQATEIAQEQLMKEKQELEKQKEYLQEAGEQLQLLLRNHRQFGHQNRMSSPHTIAQGRSQLVALRRTQKEQSRLEKIFLQQQREIRNLQREQVITKSDLLATKEHAERLQHKLEEQVKKVRKSTLLMTSYTYESRGSHGETKKVKQGVDKLLANQRTLAHEVERMRRQLADQQRRERQLEHQHDSSQQQLKETGTKIKWQAAAVRGGYDYQDFRRPRMGRTKKASKKAESEESSPYKLPNVRNTKIKQQKRFRGHQGESCPTLPAIDLPHAGQPHSDGEGSLQLIHKPKIGKSFLPKFTFSKTELQSLACFRDSEVAEQVLEWLEMQGKLSET